MKYVQAGKVMSDPKEMVRALDIDGNLIKPFKTSAKKEDLLAMYKIMVQSRQWDLYALTLQRTGRLGTFAPNLGEEAFLTAIGYALEKDDTYVAHYRCMATQLSRGVTMEQIFLYWRGSELGAKYNKGVNVTPVQVIIGSQSSIAAGMAYAYKLEGKGKIVLTTIGNGGTNEGEFHEGMNLASVRKVPLVYAISNNQWSISVPEKNSYNVKTLSQRAMSYGVPGIRVDGNDLLASYEVAKEAYEYARSGKGPVIIEFCTWRQGPHTTSDDPHVYRSEKEEKAHEKWEPFHRIEKYLFDNNILTEKAKEKIWADADAAAKKAYDASTATLSKEGYDDMFKYNYATLPAELEEQKEKYRRFIK